MTLGATGLLPRFDGRMFSATEVARGKPNPDVFLFAAERMRASCSSRVVVVEDTAVGVQAGVTRGNDRIRLRRADRLGQTHCRGSRTDVCRHARATKFDSRSWQAVTRPGAGTRRASRHTRE